MFCATPECLYLGGCGRPADFSITSERKDTALFLHELPTTTIKLVRDALAGLCQPVVIDDHNQISDETARNRVMFDAGRHSVIKELDAAIKRRASDRGSTADPAGIDQPAAYQELV